jgi:hypothetical protein
MASNVLLDSDWTSVYILLDKSGSMMALNPENTAKQVTDLVQEQRGGKVTVTAATFSDTYNVIKTNVEGKDFQLTSADIRPDGPTALQQSLCRIIDDAGKELSQMTNVRPGRVVVIVLTDGAENASKGEYAAESGRLKLSEKIKHQQDVYNWIFYFLGTNIDAINTGMSYGIDGRTCINYSNSQQGCTNVMRSASKALNRVRFANLTVHSTRSNACANTNSRDQLLNTCGFTQQERVSSQHC